MGLAEGSHGLAYDRLSDFGGGTDVACRASSMTFCCFATCSIAAALGSTGSNLVATAFSSLSQGMVAVSRHVL